MSRRLSVLGDTALPSSRFEGLSVNKLQTLLEHIEELIEVHMASEARAASSEVAETLRTLREVRAELIAAIEALSGD